MGLFTDPVVLDARSFSFRAQQVDKKSVVGDYIEDAADIAAESLLIVKHDNTGAVKRHYFQTSIYLVPAADPTGPRKRITVGTSIMADPLFTAAEVQNQMDVHVGGLTEASFVTNMLSSKI